MKINKLTYVFYIVCLIMGVGAKAQAASIMHHDEESPHHSPSGKGWGQPNSSPRQSANFLHLPQYGINYNGGPVLGAGKSPAPNIYYIWYGDWKYNSAGQSLLVNFAKNIGGTPYFNINTTYTDANGAPINNAVNFAGETNIAYLDAGAKNHILSDADVLTVVNMAIASGAFGSSHADPNGIYFVLSSKDVKETSGFCKNYCGWHNSTTNGSKASPLTGVQGAFVGDPTNCPLIAGKNPCEPQLVSPNNNPGPDAMASIIAHELAETITDPTMTAWYNDRDGSENGDRCAWTFGAYYPTPADSGVWNGSYANLAMGNPATHYLLQQIWVNAQAGLHNGYCALAY